MAVHRWFHVSLARKISLLFGSAVLLVIGVTLLFPWLQMTNLDEEALLMKANWVAGAVRQTVDLHQPDWVQAQIELEERWPPLAHELGLPAECPTIVSMKGPLDPTTSQGGAADTQNIRPDIPRRGFRREALDRLQADVGRRHFWKLQDNGRRFRYAMAVRAAPTAVHPGLLFGLIDVRLAVPRSNAIWNAVVTLLAGASGAVLAILVFYFVSQRLVLSPVASLRQVAEQVTTGDLDVRASIQSGDEFQALSGAFNEMLDNLRAAQIELRTTNRSLDIKLGELAQTNVSLYESNRFKSEFLTNVTHELRTPLVSIIGFAELLRDAWENPKADRKRLARYSENILTSGRSLLDIINDLLDLAKIEAGKIDIHDADFEIGQLCRDLIDFVRPLADKKSQTLSLDLADDLPMIHSDPGKIKQILYNLLSNAIKFTPDNGSIGLTAKRVAADHSVRMIVRDTGPGISAEQREKIFDKFYQLDSSKTREFEGTGLGLAITRELVRVLGGTIDLESELGQGTTFGVTLPIDAFSSPEGSPPLPPP